MEELLMTTTTLHESQIVPPTKKETYFVQWMPIAELRPGMFIAEPDRKQSVWDLEDGDTVKRKTKVESVTPHFYQSGKMFGLIKKYHVNRTQCYERNAMVPVAVVSFTATVEQALLWSIFGDILEGAPEWGDPE
jgi:hypothetical protein